jgi:hypothetical protein
MSIVGDIKNQIKTILDALVTGTVLGSVLMDDFKDDVLNRDIPAFPCAILTSPSIESSSAETNQDNLRTHTFEILIVQKGENVTGSNDMEDLMEALINAFDNDPTLSGKANGGVEPAVSPTVSISSGDRTYILFVITLKPKALYTRS